MATDLKLIIIFTAIGSLLDAAQHSEHQRNIEAMQARRKSILEKRRGALCKLPFGLPIWVQDPRIHIDPRTQSMYFQMGAFHKSRKKSL